MTTTSQDSTFDVVIIGTAKGAFRDIADVSRAPLRTFTVPTGTHETLPIGREAPFAGRARSAPPAQRAKPAEPPVPTASASVDSG